MLKKVYDLYSEGIKLEEVQIQYDTTLKHGDIGSHVQVLHYYLGVIFFFDDELPLLTIDSIYTENTKEMVMNFQKKYNWEMTGAVDRET